MSDPAAAGPRGKRSSRAGVSERSRGDASDIDGQTDRSNGAFGKNDIEGKAAMGSGERPGKRTSFKWAGAHESNTMLLALAFNCLMRQLRDLNAIAG